ncbi:hypothetical protein S40293_11615, partial [Stachybotrys chartarum IBT 40293]|jgi:hypothetical protein
VEA